jgi:hypothetical protein
MIDRTHDRLSVIAAFSAENPTARAELRFKSNRFLKLE